MKEKAVIALLAVCLFAPFPANAGIIAGSFEVLPFGANPEIFPGSANAVLGSFLLSPVNPYSGFFQEDVGVSTIDVDMQFTGNLEVENLMLLEDGMEIGPVIANPGAANEFNVQLFLLPQSPFPDILQIRGSLANNSSGSVTVSVPAGGIEGLGTVSLNNYTGPNITIYADTRQVGQVPEPSPALIMGAGLLGIGWLRKRAKT